MNRMQRIGALWCLWFIASLLLTLVIWFFGTVLMNFSFTYRLVFWQLFIWPAILLALFDLAFYSWMKEYKRQLQFGKLKEDAFTAACHIVSIRPPRPVIEFMEPLLSSLLRFVKTGSSSC